jgi:mRNA-degrading endonuclease RelE of RelBE toxin-antitoxin system
LPDAPLKIKFTPRADDDVEHLDAAVANRIIDKLSWLAEHPRAKVERLAGMPGHLDGLLKYRVGAYRVLFWLDDDALVIYRIGHRSEIYKDLK